MNKDDLEDKVRKIKQLQAQQIENRKASWRGSSGFATLKESLAELRKSHPSGMSTPETPIYSCPLCRDVGWVRSRAALGEATFGAAIPCRCAVDKARQQYLDRLPDMTFDNFVATEDAPAVAMARLFAEGQAKPWLLFAGKPGPGKTHLIMAILRRRAQLGVLGVYWTLPQMLGWLKGAMDNHDPDAESVESRLQSLEATALLALDDLGAEKRTEWSEEVLYRLLDERYRARRETVMATNNGIAQYDARLQDRLGDKRLVQIVRLKAPSYRTGRSYS